MHKNYKPYVPQVYTPNDALELEEILVINYSVCDNEANIILLKRPSNKKYEPAHKAGLEANSFLYGESDYFNPHADYCFDLARLESLEESLLGEMIKMNRLHKIYRDGKPLSMCDLRTNMSEMFSKYKLDELFSSGYRNVNEFLDSLK